MCISITLLCDSALSNLCISSTFKGVHSIKTLVKDLQYVKVSLRTLTPPLHTINSAHDTAADVHATPDNLKIVISGIASTTLFSHVPAPCTH